MEESPVEIVNLSPNTSYTFNFIRDNTINGIVTESHESLLFTTVAHHIPVAILRSISPFSASINLSDPYVDYFPGQNIYFYTATGVNLSISKTQVTLDQSINLSGLLPNSLYTFHFICENNVNGTITELSSNLLFTTELAPLPSTILQHVNSTNANISIYDPYDNLFPGQNSYFYKLMTGKNESIPKTSTALESSPLDISGLSPNTSYVFNFIRENSTNDIITESIAHLFFTTGENKIWYSIDISRKSDGEQFFNGYFGVDRTTNIISNFYNANEVGNNILTNTDTDADYIFVNGSFTVAGTTINNIPALDDYYNAIDWRIWNDDSGSNLSYKNKSGSWIDILPSGEVFTFTINTVPIPNFDLNTTTITSEILNQLLVSGYTLQNIMNNVNAGSTSPVTISISSDLDNISDLQDYTPHTINLVSNKKIVRITK